MGFYIMVYSSRTPRYPHGLFKGKNGSLSPLFSKHTSNCQGVGMSQQENSRKTLYFICPATTGNVRGLTLYVPEREATVLNETLDKSYQLDGTRGWRRDRCPAKTLFDPYFVVITNLDGCGPRDSKWVLPNILDRHLLLHFPQTLPVVAIDQLMATSRQ